MLLRGQNREGQAKPNHSGTNHSGREIRLQRNKMTNTSTPIYAMTRSQKQCEEPNSTEEISVIKFCEVRAKDPTTKTCLPEASLCTPLSLFWLAFCCHPKITLTQLSQRNRALSRRVHRLQPSLALPFEGQHDTPVANPTHLRVSVKVHLPFVLWRGRVDKKVLRVSENHSVGYLHVKLIPAT